MPTVVTPVDKMNKRNVQMSIKHEKISQQLYNQVSHLLRRKRGKRHVVEFAFLNYTLDNIIMYTES